MMPKIPRLSQFRSKCMSVSVTECPFASTISKNKTLLEQPTHNKKQESIRTSDEIPGPKGLYDVPFIGTALQFKPFSEHSIQNVFRLFTSYNKRYGPIVRARMGADHTVYLFDPDDIETVFRNDKKHPSRIELPLTKVHQKRTGTPLALGTLQEDEWRKRRRPLRNLVQRLQYISKYVPSLSTIADDFVDKLEDKEEFNNAFDQLMEFTSEGVGYLCFQRRLGHIDKTCSCSKSELLKHTTVYLKHLGEQFFRLPLYKLFRTPIYNSFANSYQFIYNFTKREIEHFKQISRDSQGNEQCSGGNEQCSGGNEQCSLIGSLLKDGTLSEAEICTSLVDIFVGGIDSTASAMTFLMFHLAQNPDKQERLYEEVKQFNDQEITSEILQQIPYLKACLKESFRLVYPVPGGTIRVLDKDIDIKGYRINQGTQVMLCYGTSCLNEQYIKYPESFIPERWLREEKDIVNPFIHLPFGYGPRNCLGQRFAEYQIYTLMIKIFGKYEVSFPSGKDSIPYRYTAFPLPTESVTFDIRKR
ncbi:hypothetical protein FSP39_005119 [Pinctada imbricata]|uniref:Cytochrome P450 n=1 Tax=Pinctada imbricata TaxID=66713 RepID=A0AA88XTR9_PINIB|nr:hypothetical protein FSP39_005119 [Pinctada imbricata]